MTKKEFEDQSRRLLSQDADISSDDLAKWVLGRDWLAKRIIRDDQNPSRRRYPRAKLALPAHIAGIGNALTEDIGFRGMALWARRLPRLRTGEEQSVRVSILGRSIYATATVVWADAAASRLGLSITAIHPSDELALQAAVCVQHIDRWLES